MALMERLHLRAMKTSTEGDKQLANPCRRARVTIHKAMGRRPNLRVEMRGDITVCAGCSLSSFLTDIFIEFPTDSTYFLGSHNSYLIHINITLRIIAPSLYYKYDLKVLFLYTSYVSLDHL